MINNSDFGGFIVSNNILEGKPIRYTFRDQSIIPPLNGWNLLSIEDDEEYLSDAANFKILGADSIYEIAPVMLEIFEAPYGTDLCWLYEEGVHVGFYDLVEERNYDRRNFIFSKLNRLSQTQAGRNAVGSSFFIQKIFLSFLVDICKLQV